MTDYRSYLKQELVERSLKNTSYSLRAFGRDLGLGSGTLSEVIHGKRNLSQAKAYELSQKLGHDTKETDYFCLLVQFNQTKNMSLKKSYLEKVQAFHPKHRVSHDLSIDAFKSISDWQHYAVLQLFCLDHFEVSPRSIAKFLGVKTLEAEVILERLERLDLIEKLASGDWKRTHQRFFFESKEKNQALRRFHKHMLEKSIKSLEHDSPEDKYTGTETMAFDKSDLDKFRKLTEHYFNKVNELAEKSKNKTEVYHLNVNFFNLRGAGK